MKEAPGTRFAFADFVPMITLLMTQLGSEVRLIKRHRKLWVVLGWVITVIVIERRNVRFTKRK